MVLRSLVVWETLVSKTLDHEVDVRSAVGLQAWLWSLEVEEEGAGEQDDSGIKDIKL